MVSLFREFGHMWDRVVIPDAFFVDQDKRNGLTQESNQPRDEIR